MSRQEVNTSLVRRYGASRGSIRDLIIKVVRKREGGEMFSPTLREIFRVHHGVDVGMYTHGGCFHPFSFGPNTTIGRYTSIAATAFAATDNHPMQYKSMHGFFFNPVLGIVDKEWAFEPLSIGNDVWLGHNSIIMPGVGSIGDGAVVAAGAVVNKSVPPYAVVVGNPARVVRYRFDPDTIERLRSEKWWEKDIEELKLHLDQYTRAYGVAGDDEPAHRPAAAP
ncbi:MAG: CatB-related O-acetyltransferase [Propionibacteriaceae bacterium]|jgi:acetyltransferase-like isoleucine patch superfamily enzyme|nr:CatB-related O-acetyltransferase [Propionibacteriaceae bacterium]